MHVLSHDKSLAPKMVHLVRLMLVVQMNQLLVRTLLHLFVRDVLPLVFSATGLPAHAGTALVLSRVAPSTHATPSLLLPFSSYPYAFM